MTRRPSSPKTTAYDVFVVAGQSNVLNGLSSAPAGDPDPRIVQLGRARADNASYGYSNGDRAFVEAREPLQHWSMGKGFCGFALPFARAYLASGLMAPSRKALLIPCGAGGAGFSTKPGWAPDQSYLQDAIDRANFVLSEAPGSEIKAVLWHQGEADSHGSHNQTAYRAAITELIASFRRGVGGDDPPLPFILGQMVPSGVLKTHRWARHVQNAIDLVPFYARATAVVRNDGLTSNGEELGIKDFNHFSAASHLELGSRYFDAYLYLLSEAIRRKVRDRDGFIAS